MDQTSPVSRLKAEVADLRYWVEHYTSTARELDSRGRPIWKDGCAAAGIVSSRRLRREALVALRAKEGRLRLLQEVPPC
jgi:hypothetical protein